MLDSQPDGPMPNAPGVGYKPQHLSGILANAGAVEWLEIHAENYMGEGGPQLAQLRHLRERFPVSCHGVGLSIGAEGRLDGAHLARLKKLVGWLKPALFSEHLAWSTHDMGYLNDLLPLPYNMASVKRVAAHIDEVQTTIGRQMLLENPSLYVAFTESTMDEIGFLREVQARTGCGLLLDVNNVFVSATNQNYSPEAFIDAFPVEHVGEIHLGGHNAQQDDHGAPLLIDSHDAAVVDPVWALYARTIARAGPRPTLIEWDSDIPEWPVLQAEAARAAAILAPVTAKMP
ncbi:MAG: DUF692 domain-containing protein [Paracoccaceae bacterium]